MLSSDELKRLIVATKYDVYENSHVFVPPVFPLKPQLLFTSKAGDISCEHLQQVTELLWNRTTYFLALFIVCFFILINYCFGKNNMLQYFVKPNSYLKVNFVNFQISTEYSRMLSSSICMVLGTPSNGNIKMCANSNYQGRNFYTVENFLVFISFFWSF